MVEGEIKLLGTWPSPFAIRVKMVLEQKGLSYEYLEDDLLNKSELLLKHNPIYKKVPVLIHGDRAICESLVILQYIDENWSKTGLPVLPVDPYERAIARFWATYVDDKLVTSFIGILKATTEEAKAQKIADTHTALELLEGAFKKCSAGKDFFGGDSIGYIDVTLGSCLAWIKAAERISGAKLLDETKVPLLMEWVNRFLATDCAKRTLPDVERVEKYGRNLQVTTWNVVPAK
ncbi:hypothetical protein LUZ61_019565 [Rhynchospora tenuis]|uniref:glutathione transferase n=1 Tax=Rhynchospora tenuis TaxID=198213 RepID=A0AAD5ZBB1_9POAL|nr:hypothetical protein LUZ61_019550 [Rhynchospora tenuis]KAJ3690401.1 hypothetical protein LUZ61_019565 [Rhynchospora tenuis]